MVQVVPTEQSGVEFAETAVAVAGESREAIIDSTRAN
jgi:hypothetical protein